MCHAALLAAMPAADSVGAASANSRLANASRVSPVTMPSQAAVVPAALQFTCLALCFSRHVDIGAHCLGCCCEATITAIQLLQQELQPVFPHSRQPQTIHLTASQHLLFRRCHLSVQRRRCQQQMQHWGATAPSCHPQAAPCQLAPLHALLQQALASPHGQLGTQVPSMTHKGGVSLCLWAHMLQM